MQTRTKLLNKKENHCEISSAGYPALKNKPFIFPQRVTLPIQSGTAPTADYNGHFGGHFLKI
jgi:hypothetical protein